MCRYHYIYFAKCQHASFYCVSYCDKANALSLPLQDNHSRDGSGADTKPDSLPDPSSSQPPASADASSSSHSHSQHITQNMSTLAHQDTGSSLPQHLNALPIDEQTPQHLAQVPRSVLAYSDETSLIEGVSHTSTVLETAGQEGLRMAVSLTSQSHSSLGNPHEASYDDVSGTSQASARRGSVASVATFRGPNSPRKPIPSQWLPVNSGPNLATAQRAKERDHKTGSVHGSPVDAKTLGSARSVADIKQHVAEGGSFLTKTAHTAIDSDLTASSSVRRPTKQHRTSSKPAWNSPTGSPRRDSPQQQPHLIIKTSPVKTAVPDAGVGSQHHRRGTSVATSTGDTIYHSAESSPVRGSVEAESPPETLEHISELQLRANHELEQVSTSPIHSQTTSRTTVTGIGAKPSLKILIPATDPSTISGEKTAEACSSTSGGSLWSPKSPQSLSRVPRVAGTSATSARGPTLSSSLKRVQAAKSLTSLKARIDSQARDTIIPHSDITPAAPVRHAHFVDTHDSSQGSTKHPIMRSTPRLIPAAATSDVSPIFDLSSSLSGEDAVEVTEQANFSKPGSESSRASSLSTVKAAPSYRDPILADSAIIYSKKQGACGTTLDQPLDVPPLIAMMAHNIEIGTFSKGKQPQDVPDIDQDLAHDGVSNASPVRGRATQFVPTSRRQAESSEHSLHSSLSSDLRATAPAFVPYPSTSAQQENVSDEAPSQPVDLLGAAKYELDMYGIPWFYYMYQVQIAYEQGFQTGRAKSPKKTRQKKTNPARAQTYAEASKSSSSSSPSKQHAPSSSSMPPPASTIPLAEQRAQRLSEISIASAPDFSNNGGKVTPFREQHDLVDAHSRFSNMVISERPLPGIDITSIRNVPGGPRSNTMSPHPSHSRNQHQHRRSGNGLYTYHGRGVPMGLRMHDTAPFSAPVPPPGRSVRVTEPEKGCEVVDIVYAAENGGGDGCFECEPDHPLD